MIGLKALCNPCKNRCAIVNPNHHLRFNHSITQKQDDELKLRELDAFNSQRADLGDSEKSRIRVLSSWWPDNNQFLQRKIRSYFQHHQTWIPPKAEEWNKQSDNTANGVLTFMGEEGKQPQSKHFIINDTLGETDFDVKDVILTRPQTLFPGRKGFISKYIFGNTRRTRMIKAATELYERVVYQAERDEFFDVASLEHNFEGWHGIMLVHIWMVLVRLRQDGADGTEFGQLFFERFWYDTEHRLIAAGLDNPLYLGKYLKHYATAYWGGVVAYDEGLVGSDAVLADALWRNLYKGNYCDAELLNCMVKYIRRELLRLEKNPFVMKGFIKFGDPIVPETLSNK